MSCCIPFSRMLIFPSTGRRKTPNKTEQVERRHQREGMQCLSDTSVQRPAGPSARGSGGSGPDSFYFQFSQNIKLSNISASLHKLFLSPGAFPPQLTLLIPTDSSSLSLDFYFPGVNFQVLLQIQVRHSTSPLCLLYHSTYYTYCLFTSLFPPISL